MGGARVPFQCTIALGLGYSATVIVDRNFVEEREDMEYGLERVG